VKVEVSEAQGSVPEEKCPAGGSHPLRVMPEEPGSSNVFNSYAQSKAPTHSATAPGVK
jgi:hypothetical protein